MADLEEMPVGDVMRRWPATMRVFLDHRMHCIGCPIACLHTVKEACREHAVDQNTFEAAIHAIIKAGSGERLAKDPYGAPAAY